MTRTAAPTAPAVESTEDERRRRPVWKPLAAAGIGGAVLLAAGYGVFASLSATATSGTQDITSGTLALTLDKATGSAGFTTPIANLAPTDTVNRFITLTNNGTLVAKDLALKVAATGSSALITGGGNIKPLQVTVDSCAVAWVNGACSTPTSVLAATNVSALSGSTPTLLSGERASGAISYLRVSVSLPDQDETTINGVVPTANTIQGQTATLTWTFSEVQRAGTNTNS